MKIPFSVVMLTPICERGRVKCHPYWPQSPNSSVIYHQIQITTLKETKLPHWIQREFQLKNLEVRSVTLAASSPFVMNSNIA